MRCLFIAAACLVTGVAGSASALEPVPTPIGVGPRFHPTASNPRVVRAERIGRLVCRQAVAARAGAHLELFAHGRVVIVPAGVGVAPPLRTTGAYVVSGRCSYAARTREPTGVIELSRPVGLTLGDFFRVWGRPLSSRRLLGFRARPGAGVRAYVDGRLWRRDPRAVPLGSHAQIVLELGAYVPPHASYRFPKGL